MDESVLKTLVIDFKREALRKGFRVTFSTRGMSMSPIIRTNDKIVVADCDMSKLKSGDLILFQGNGGSDKIVAHRLVRKIKNRENYFFVTKGDALKNYDRPISGDRIIGKIIEIRKPHFKISLDSSFGKVINLYLLFISLSRIIPLGRKILRKMKAVLKY